ncbi:hypothetical protein [Bacillus mycoides]|uniref:hypothetical protein n=1 Tax=Bacillus mycoides TaxID=1405 RepID=UPI001C01B2F2|nr:hypothetical protein [Bacillus mycoides]QWH42875.1 hypothetical protein EXW53_26740 [Bacillus mycoides]
MNKYYMSAILSIVLSVVLFTFNYYQTKRGGVIFALSIGASVKFLADGVLNEGKHKKHN